MEQNKCNYSKEIYDQLKGILPKDFFIRTRPHKTEKDPPEDMIPFEWPKEVLEGKVKAIVVAGDSKKN